MPGVCRCGGREPRPMPVPEEVGRWRLPERASPRSRRRSPKRLNGKKERTQNTGKSNSPHHLHFQQHVDYNRGGGRGSDRAGLGGGGGVLKDQKNGAPFPLFNRPRARRKPP